MIQYILLYNCVLLLKNLQIYAQRKQFNISIQMLQFSQVYTYCILICWVGMIRNFANITFVFRAQNFANGFLSRNKIKFHRIINIASRSHLLLPICVKISQIWINSDLFAFSQYLNLILIAARSNRSLIAIRLFFNVHQDNAPCVSSGKLSKVSAESLMSLIAQIHFQSKLATLWCENRKILYEKEHVPGRYCISNETKNIKLSWDCPFNNQLTENKQL
jgi:hypothetical protein